MKKFTYQITIEAEHQDDADNRMKGLSLLTESPVQQNTPLTEDEEFFLEQFRATSHTGKLSMLLAGAVFEVKKTKVPLS